MSPKPVVLIAEQLSPATVEALGPDFEIRHCNGADRSELLPAIADVDAILLRSATKVDAEVIAAAKRLKVVARAGVGLDNVDVTAATQAGVMVVNAPTSNIVTAAELACGLIIATARNIPQADAALKNGEWKRSKYTGVELSEKTLGVVGLGRIGVLVAQRMSAFGMKIVAYDPYVQPARAAQMGAQLLSLDELLEVSDFITVHLPKTPETLGLIGDEALYKVKPTVRIINAARGGIVDEEALFSALKEGRVTGAGLDVYATEPCTDSPLFQFDQVVCTPHLGASTDEAQEKAGIAVANSVRLALAGELVPDAVNVQGGVISEDVRPVLPLAENLGRIFTALAGEVAVRLDVEVYGEITQHDVKVLELSALKGVFEDIVEETVSYVNAPLFAQQRGVEVRLTTNSASPDHRTMVTVRGTLTDGEEIAVSGTLAGMRHIQKIVSVGKHGIDLPVADHLIFLRYSDRPGVIGTVGGILGQAGINIAGMQVSRSVPGGEALIALSVDNTVPPDVVGEIAQEIGATSARTVSLD
ncbi:phosphoglycerate dehydrogenase [Streptomyces lavendulocolor]|uniref:D-3-phosphoglycerate dehydrogenase n=1 Tax=Streptomyces lavendulocolor TaxID=67316 RepID=A0ABV2W247_9ACTN|nr:D-3-phosphoglycerate dehydrogenase [Streptomyces cellulosae]